MKYKSFSIPLFETFDFRRIGKTNAFPCCFRFVDGRNVPLWTTYFTRSVFSRRKKKANSFSSERTISFLFFFFFCRLFQRYWLFLLFTPMKEGFQRILLRFAQLRNSFDEIFFQSCEKSNFYFIDFYISTSKQHESWKMRFDEERKKGKKNNGFVTKVKTGLSKKKSLL